MSKPIQYRKVISLQLKLINLYLKVNIHIWHLTQSEGAWGCCYQHLSLCDSVVGKAVSRRDESSLPPLSSFVNLEDTASAEVPCPSVNGYLTAGSTWCILLLDKLLEILALLSSIPGLVLLDWNKTPVCRLFAVLEGWGKFLTEDVPDATGGTELSGHHVATTDVTRSHLRGAVFRVQLCVPVVPAS